MQNESQQTLIEHILREVASDHFALPTLPGIATRIQCLLNDPNVSADQIVTALSGDPVITAQLIRSANSAMFANPSPVDNVRDAVSRLGYRQMHNLVISITMNQLFHSANAVINQRMQRVWEHSRKVAAVSRVLASRLPHLSPDQAMLAGLMHNIGMLPLYLHIERNHPQIDDDTLAVLCRKTHQTIGAKLLESWRFPPEIIAVVLEHENLHRASGTTPLADYADVIMFANLQHSARAIAVAWDNIAALQRLGISQEECRTFLAQNAGRIEAVEILLGIRQKTKPVAAAAPVGAAQITAAPPVNGGLLSFLLRLWR